MITRREFLDAVMSDGRLTAAQRELLRLLIDRCDKDGIVVPNAAELMEHFNLSQTAVYNRIGHVTHNGYLREVGTEGRQRIYQITLPDRTAETIESRVTTLEQEIELLKSRVIGLELRTE